MCSARNEEHLRRRSWGYPELAYRVAVEIEAEVEIVESALAIEVRSERLQRSA